MAARNRTYLYLQLYCVSNTFTHLGTGSSMATTSVSLCTELGSYQDNWEEVFYAPVPHYVHYTVGCFLLVVMIFGFVGNSFSIYLFATYVVKC